MLDTSIQVKTDSFDGPLALLLHLIEKEEMDIRRLDLKVITRQYLDYLDKMRELNFDLAGDYLYLAATLILLKSRTAISEEENARLKEQMDSDGLNITSQSELIRRLEELQRFQRLGQKIWKLPRLGQEIFVKPKVDRKAIANSILTPTDIGQLTQAMMDIIQKQKRRYSVMKRDRLTIKEKLIELKKVLSEGERVEFEHLLLQAKEGRSIANIIVTFISVLELARHHRVSLFQNEPGSSIFIDVLKGIAEFDVQLAAGDYEEEDATKDLPVEEAQTPEETAAFKEQPETPVQEEVQEEAPAEIPEELNTDTQTEDKTLEEK